jgi:hypothetical protein
MDREFAICRRCFGVYSTSDPEGLMQACACRPSEKPWERHDFNEHIHLCECCVQTTLPSGSKWSVWFCKECDDLIRNFNDEHGFAVIPRGRHSIMAGVSLSGDQARSKRAIKTFHDAMMSLFDRMDVLHRWSHERMGEHLEALDITADISLDDYLTRMQQLRRGRHGFSKRASFRGLVEHFRQELR